MFLGKVKDLEQVKLGTNQVLVELHYKRYTGSIVLAGESGNESSTSELTKMEIIASNYELVNVGDLVVDGRVSMGQNGLLKVGDRTFAVMAGHDIKVWATPDNYDENKEEKKESSLITEAKQGFNSADLKKIESEARGLNSKYLNNK